MMSVGHAATGAAGIALLGLIPGLMANDVTLATGIFAGAGAALLPDWDHEKATVATTFGWFSKKIAGKIEGISAFIYLATRSGRDARRQGGHRTLTHTFLFAIAIGILTVWGSVNNLIVNNIVLFILMCLGLRGLFPKTTRKNGKLFLYSAASLLPLSMYIGIIPSLPALSLGIMISVGSAIHSMGDCLTNSGAPLMFPIPIRRQIWYRFRTPIRFSTGTSKGRMIEKWIKVQCCIIIAAVFLIRWFL